MSDKPLKKCTLCNSNKVTKLISAGSGFILGDGGKSGWAKDNYADKSGVKPTEIKPTTKPAASDPTKSPNTKTYKKP